MDLGDKKEGMWAQPPPGDPGVFMWVFGWMYVMSEFRVDH